LEDQVGALQDDQKEAVVTTQNDADVELKSDEWNTNVLDIQAMPALDSPDLSTEMSTEPWPTLPHMDSGKRKTIAGQHVSETELAVLRTAVNGMDLQPSAARQFRGKNERETQDARNDVLYQRQWRNDEKALPLEVAADGPPKWTSRTVQEKKGNQAMKSGANGMNQPVQRSRASNGLHDRPPKPEWDDAKKRL
jgi:hypothetical protein